MEEMKKTVIQLPRSSQKPVKTEWNSRCVLFTYFQGDISSVVDEHFSRALGNIKSPQGLSPWGQSKDVILRNDSDMPPNQWRISPPWTKPQPEVSLANGVASRSLNVPDPVAVAQFPHSLTGSPSAQPAELWHLSSLASPSSPEPGYPRAILSGHLAPEPRPDGKCEPLLSLHHRDKCLARPQESATREDYNPVQIAGSTGLLLNLPPSSVYHKKIHVSPNRGPATSSLANETPNFWGHPRGCLQHL